MLKQEAAQEGRQVVVAVAGCVAQAEGKEIIRRANVVDLVIGPQNYHRLPDLIVRAERGEKVIDNEFPLDDKFAILKPPSPEATRARGVSAFVTVQEGCDKFCTFCVVPYTRGAEISRPVESIVAEVDRLAEAGVREVTLIGQNVNAYHGEGADGQVVAARAAAVSSRRGAGHRAAALHHQSSMRHGEQACWPRTATCPALMPLLHLPVQSGSDRILAAMNRRHTRADYLDIVAQARATQPDIAFTSDFIVGFPGESEDDFRATLSLIDEVGYASAYTFKYSARPGTPAADMAGQVPEDVKSERLRRLQSAIDRQYAAFRAQCVGRTFDVLFERRGRYPGQLAGRSPYLLPVQVMAPETMIGEIAPVTITDISANSLFGALAANRAHAEQVLAAAEG